MMTSSGFGFSQFLQSGVDDVRIGFQVLHIVGIYVSFSTRSSNVGNLLVLLKFVAFRRRCQHNLFSVSLRCVHYSPTTGEFEFKPRRLSSPNVVLGDEINRASPKTQAALLEAMEEYVR